MTTLEKLAERVREQGGIATLSCEVCACKPRNSERCMQHSCPQEQAPDGALMLARWAVKLVAEGLEEEVEALKERKAVLAGMTNNSLRDAAGYGGCEYTPRQWKKAGAERDAMARGLANGLLALITEAKEGSDGRQG